MSSQPHHRGSKKSFGKSHKKQSKSIWKTITVLKMSTSNLVLELDHPPVSRDGSSTEDLNHSKPFGLTESIAAPIPYLGKDPVKHHLAGVVVPAVGSLWCFGGHNGVSSCGVVGSDIIAQAGQVATKRLGRVSAEACEVGVHLYYPNIGTKKRPPKGPSLCDKQKADSKDDHP